MDNQEKTYSVDQRDDIFSVVSPSGTNILECRDEHSARHYAVLLSTAWRAGYKEGYRATRPQDD